MYLFCSGILCFIFFRIYLATVQRCACFITKWAESCCAAGLWAVVNNAGVSMFGEVEFTTMDTYKQVSEVNLWGTIRVTKAVLPLIRRAKGPKHAW